MCVVVVRWAMFICDLTSIVLAGQVKWSHPCGPPHCADQMLGKVNSNEFENVQNVVIIVCSSQAKCEVWEVEGKVEQYGKKEGYIF